MLRAAVLRSPNVPSCKPGSTVTLTWDVANIGGEAWPPHCTLRPVQADGSLGPSVLDVPEVPGLCQLELGFELPLPSTPGATIFQQLSLASPSGEAFGEPLEFRLQLPRGRLTARSEGLKERPHPDVGVYPGDYTRKVHLKYKPDAQPAPMDWKDPEIIRASLDDVEGWHVVRQHDVVPSQVLSTFGQPAGAQLRFRVNGEQHIVRAGSYPVSTTLAEYLRYQRNLTGTKIGCGEGGCGACTVALRVFMEDGETAVPDSKLIVNSCLRPLHSVDNMEVTTIENVGTPSSPHRIQEAMHRHHASQCGMCTPGFVMAIYGHLSGDASPQDAESCIQGNLCRCTGYRPIYDAIHEVCGSQQAAAKRTAEPKVPRLLAEPARNFMAVQNGQTWLNCFELKDVFTALQEYSTVPHKLVVGNTAMGVVKYYPPHQNDAPEVYINIQHVQKLLECEDVHDNLVVGAAVSLSSLIDTLSYRTTGVPQFQAIIAHLKLVAHPQVRNVGSWAGNVMTAKTHPDFPSDVCLLLTLLDAKLRLVDGTGTCEEMDVPSFLRDGSVPRVGKDAQIIESVAIPRPRSTSVIHTFKVMRRRMNTHADINAGFLFDFTDATGIEVASARVVVGNVARGPFLAQKAAAALAGKGLTSPAISEFAAVLTQEITENILDPTVPDPPFPVVSKKYRATLAGNLALKAGLRARAGRLGLSALSPQEQSAAEDFRRAPSHGTQKFEPGDPAQAPLYQPVAKYEGLEQACGTASFTADSPLSEGALFGVFVLAKSIGTISKIDISEALKLEGVREVMTAPDVKAVGASLKVNGYAYKIFADAEEPTQHVGQIVALVLGESFEAARKGAKVVDVKYVTRKEQPVLTHHQATDKQQTYGTIVLGEGANHGPRVRENTVEGIISSNGQRHMYMETQTALAEPGTNGGITVTTSCQVFDSAQQMLAKTLNIPQAKVKIQNTRIGGAYGGKGFLFAPVAAAAAVAALKTKGQVLIQMDRTDDFVAFAGRNPFEAKWTCSYDEVGKITALTQDISIQCGADKGAGENSCTGVNCYDVQGASMTQTAAATDTPTCTIMRAPGPFESAFIMEATVEHISRATGLDHTKVQEANHLPEMKRVVDALKAQVGYDALRSQVDNFNANTRYQKQGLYCMQSFYTMTPATYYEKSTVAVHGDGSISIKHSGIEQGQGIDTKAVQACAQAFMGMAADFSPDKITVVAPKSTSFFSWNFVMGTWGSVTSEAIAAAVSAACTKLKEEIQPYAVQGRAWSTVVAAALAGGAKLVHNGEHYPGLDANYNVTCAACSRVQLDVLTGQTQVLSFDLVYDCGKSLNPAVDIGQMEGSIVQAMGFSLMEEEVRSKEDGRMVNCGTWDYKIPSGLDIPINMNVTLLPPDPESTEPTGCLSSKASGEPAQLVGPAVFFAVKEAIYAARKDAGLPSQYIRLDPPASPERVLLALSATDTA